MPHRTPAVLIVMAWALAGSAGAETWLRSGVVQHSSPGHTSGRRLLQQGARYRHAAWGELHGKTQYLLQLDGGRAGPALHPGSQQGELLARLRGAGALVSGFLPPATWLVLAPPSFEAQPQAWRPHNLVPLQPGHKVAPELRDEAEAARVGGEPGLAGSGDWLAHEAGREGPGGEQPAGTGPGRRRAGATCRRLAIATTLVPVSGEDVRGPASRHQPAAAAAQDWAAALAALVADGGCAPLVRPSGQHSAMVLAAPQDLPAVVAWLAAQPAVHWLAPAPARSMRNSVASSLTQGVPIGNVDQSLTSRNHPYWGLGLDGTGQIIGVGDSGIDMKSCYFADPAVPFKQTGKLDGQPYFNSTRHRKVVFYLALRGANDTDMGDLGDGNGHGTHCAGTLAGVVVDDQGEAVLDLATGMAPGAKLAFLDLSGPKDGMSVNAPDDYSASYAQWTYDWGARIHSDSWGASWPWYDANAASIDLWHATHPDFVQCIAAGNAGVVRDATSSITSPATAKNNIAVGATQSVLLDYGSNLAAPVYTMTVASTPQAPPHQAAYRVVQAAFGGSAQRLAGKRLPLVAADPVNGCGSSAGRAPAAGHKAVKGAAPALSGAVLLVQRGGCRYTEKLRLAQQAGAAAVVLTDNRLGGYELLEGVAKGDGAGLTIPMLGLPVSVGRTLWRQVADAGGCSSGGSSSCGLTVAIGPDSAKGLPAYEDVAEYSSFGPTLDGRIKPDVVAPGETVSASSKEACGWSDSSGTSMATPVVAGNLAIIRQYFTDGWYPGGAASSGDAYEPSGALMKAVLLGGASPLLGNTELGLPLEPPPSFRQGYGMVNLTRSLPVAGGATGWRMQVVDAAELAHGQSHSYCVTSTGGPLSVMLVWMDVPALPSTTKALVNDLDLTVQTSQGRLLLGNNFADDLNVNERVLVDSMPAGPVDIRVTARHVFTPAGAQPYALVVLGKFKGVLASPANPDPAGGAPGAGCATQPPAGEAASSAAELDTLPLVDPSLPLVVLLPGNATSAADVQVPSAAANDGAAISMTKPSMTEDARGQGPIVELLAVLVGEGSPQAATPHAEIQVRLNASDSGGGSTSSSSSSSSSSSDSFLSGDGGGSSSTVIAGVNITTTGLPSAVAQQGAFGVGNASALARNSSVADMVNITDADGTGTFSYDEYDGIPTNSDHFLSVQGVPHAARPPLPADSPVQGGSGSSGAAGGNPAAAAALPQLVRVRQAQAPPPGLRRLREQGAQQQDSRGQGPDGVARRGPFLLGGSDLAPGVWTHVPNTAVVSLSGLALGGTYTLEARAVGASGMVGGTAPPLLLAMPGGDAAAAKRDGAAAPRAAPGAGPPAQSGACMPGGSIQVLALAATAALVGVVSMAWPL